MILIFSPLSFNMVLVYPLCIIHILYSKSDSEVKKIGPPVYPKPIRKTPTTAEEREAWAREVITSKIKLPTERISLFTKPKPYERPSFETEILKNFESEKKAYQSGVLIPRADERQLTADGAFGPKDYEQHKVELNISKPSEKQKFEMNISESIKNIESVVSGSRSFETHMYKTQMSKDTTTGQLAERSFEVHISKPWTNVTEKQSIDTQVFRPVPFKIDTLGKETRANKTKQFTTEAKPQGSVPIKFAKPTPFGKQTIDVDIKGREPKQVFTEYKTDTLQEVLLPKPKPYEKQTIEVEIKGREPKPVFTEYKTETLREVLLPKPKPYEKQIYTVEFPDSEPETKSDGSSESKYFKQKRQLYEIKEHVVQPRESRETTTVGVKFAEVPETIEKEDAPTPIIDRARPRSYDETDRSTRSKMPKRSVSFDESVKTDDSASEAEARRMKKKPSDVTVTRIDWTTSDESTDEIFTKVVKIKRKQSPTPEKLIIHGDYFPEKVKKHKRVRARKIIRRRTREEYQPIPYVSGPATTWVPERTDVLEAVKTWARYWLIGCF